MDVVEKMNLVETVGWVGWILGSIPIGFKFRYEYGITVYAISIITWSVVWGFTIRYLRDSIEKGGKKHETI